MIENIKEKQKKELKDLNLIKLNIQKAQKKYTLLNEEINKNNQDIKIFESICMKQTREIEIKTHELELNKQKLYILLDHRKLHEEEIKREKEFIESLEKIINIPNKT